MNANRWTRSYLILLPLATPLQAQGAWTKAPALPTACYSERDKFLDDAPTASSALRDAITKQDSTNRSLVQQIFEMDNATRQQRLMALMQKDPAKGTEIMTAIQSLGTPESQGASLETEQGEIRFAAEQQTLTDAYHADFTALLDPIGRRTQVSESGATAAEVAAATAALAEYNQKYETVLCPRWFGKAFPAFLAKYREYLVRDLIPRRQAVEAAGGRQLELFGVPTKGYQPVAEMRGVVEYLDRAYYVFRERLSGPLKPF